MAQGPTRNTRLLLAAITPVIDGFGARLLGPEEIARGDIPLSWDGRIVAGVRLPQLPNLHDALDRLVADVERELGSPLNRLSREDKQMAVRLLDDRGAFVLRKSVEDVADRLGVSRFTVYNYLSLDGDLP